MAVENNVSIIKAALDNGENVVITGDAGLGKTYLLKTLGAELKSNGKKVINCFPGDSLNEENTSFIAHHKLKEVICNEESTFLLIDELDNLVEAETILSCVKPTVSIIATTQNLNELVKMRLDKYFKQVINLSNNEVIQL